METRHLSSASHLLALASLGLACLTETKLVLSPKAGVESDEGTSRLLLFLGAVGSVWKQVT